MRKILTLLLGLSFAATALAAEPARAYLEPYNELLAAHVHPGEMDGFPGMMVNYKAWGEDKRHEEAMRLLKQVKPEKLSAAEAKAFWINAYNLLTIDLILQHKEEKTIRNIGELGDDPWHSFSWEIGGKPVKLYDIERNRLSRKADLRLHMALANGSLSGADLRPEAYTVEALETQLDDQVTRFLANDAKGLKTRGTVLEVSKLFQTYAQDFDNNGGVVAFIRHYQPSLPANAVVQGFFEWNWDLNGIW